MSIHGYLWQTLLSLGRKYRRWLDMDEVKEYLVNKVLDCTRINLQPNDVLCVDVDPSVNLSKESEKYLKEILVEAFGPDQKFIYTRGVRFTIVREGNNVEGTQFVEKAMSEHIEGEPKFAVGDIVQHRTSDERGVVTVVQHNTVHEKSCRVLIPFGVLNSCNCEPVEKFNGYYQISIGWERPRIEVEECILQRWVGGEEPTMDES